MAKAKLIDSARELETEAKELFERIKTIHTEMGTTLQDARRTEGRLIEKEKAAEEERVKAERAERLKELLESDGASAYHVGSDDDYASESHGSDGAPAAEAKPAAEAAPETAAKQVKAKTPPEEKKQAEANKPIDESKPTAEKKPADEKKSAEDNMPAEEKKSVTEQIASEKAKPVEAAKPAPETEAVKPEKKAVPEETQARAQEPASAPQKVQEKAAAPVQRAETPAPADTATAPAGNVSQQPQRRASDGYKPQPQAQTAYQPRTDRPGGYQPRTDRPGGYQPRTDNRQGGYQPRTDRPGGYQPRTDRPGGYQPRTDRPGGYQPRTDRPGGYQPRTDRPGGYQPRTDRPGGYQPRTDNRQGGYQPRTDRPGGYQPRTDRPGGYQPRPASTPTVASSTQERTRPYDPNKNAKKPGSRDDDRRNKNKKALLKETAPVASGWDDDSRFGSRKRGKKQMQQPKPEPVKIEKAVITSETITVKELSEKIGKPAAEIIKKLFILGIMATINQEIDFDTCSLIASDYGIELEQNIAKTAEDVLMESSDEADEGENLVPRPPVVTIMGHVDHGKTSLLDAIRHSSITEGEAGGITQHIGAYTVNCNGKTITFIDTPGHEAFTAMRARGAQVTDIVILVVAADDGIMPQTIEAINHSKAANVPIIVAINKMDKPTANPERIKQQLTEQGLVCEEWGGDTICVPVSAKTKMGLDNLLEMVLLQADVLELKANPKRLAKGTIVEAQLDKGRGPIATVLVQNGTLRTGDTIVAGTAYGRVRAMVDDKGRKVTSAGPSTPVEVLGFSEVPSAGDTLNVAELDKLSRQVAEERRDKQKAEQIKSFSKVSLDDLFSQIAEGDIKDLNLIIKADVQGSVEAVKQALEKLSNEEVHVKCIHGGVGAINASDVMFASASNAIIVGFNVRPDSTARAAAEKEKVDIRLYRIIYNAIEDIQNAMKGMFKPVFEEVDLGRISVRETFKVSGVGTIAGAYVQDGKVNRAAQVRVVRDGIILHVGKIGSLKRFKDDVKEVVAGYECGISIENFNDIQVGDSIEAFAVEEVKK